MNLIQSIASPVWSAGFRVITSRCESCQRSFAMRNLSAHKAGITMHGCWYCSSACFKAAAEKKLSDLLSTGQEQVNHVTRMPLGLILVGRNLVTAEQLREATDEQKEAGGEIGEILVRKGEVGYVRDIGTYLQQFYIYAVEWIDSGTLVGMRAKELESLAPPAP